MTSLEDGLKILFDEIDKNCKITNFESVVAEDDFSVILRTKLTNCDNNWGQVCNKWVEKFTNQTNSKWIVKATYPTVHRMDYRKVFICKENRIGNRNPDKFCKSRIDIKVKKVTKNTLKKDLLLQSGYNVVIKEPNRNECLKGAIQDAIQKLANGNKELNTPIFDPLMIDAISIPPGPGVVHVDQHYKNLKVFNILKSSQIKDVKATVTPDGFDMHLDLFSPEYRMEADYTLNGRVLLLPIKGDGPCVILLDDIETHIQVSADTFEKDGKTFSKIKRITVDLEPKKITYKFDNLFNGDKNLGDNMNKMLNENWQTVYHDVKTSYEDMIATELTKYSDLILTNFEYNALFP